MPNHRENPRGRQSERRHAISPLSIILAAGLCIGACNNSGVMNNKPSKCKAAAVNIPLPVAPDSERVDLAVPVFSNPGNVTNPLFPISSLASVVLLGESDGEPFRSETTLLPGTKRITWNGEQEVEALESQYVAYLDGRLHEVALDWYVQDDDGNVWYLGEDVFNYEDGRVAEMEGTWISCEDGPAAMIMPANPRVGDVYRPENSFGIVFEEVEVKSIGRTVPGPYGSVNGAILVEELHADGTYEDKTFAPGYGEFSTGAVGSGNLEVVAVAVPANALPGALPAELETLLSGANEIFDAAEAEQWKAVEASAAAMSAAWTTYRAGGVSAMLEAQMNDALESLDQEIPLRDPFEVRQAAVEVARATLDFRLRHRPPTEIDLGRFDQWVRQVLLDAEGNDRSGVRGDVSTLEWVWDRFAHTIGGTAAAAIEAELGALRAAADAGNLPVATASATRLREMLDAL